MPNQPYWDGQEYPAWSRGWSAPSDFDAPTGPIPVPVVVRAEQSQEVGTSNVVPTIIFTVSFLLAFLLAVGVIWITTASLT